MAPFFLTSILSMFVVPAVLTVITGVAVHVIQQELCRALPDWVLRDMKTGVPLLKVQREEFPVYQCNRLNPDVRKWWAHTIGRAVQE